jgi:hypothetical protein
MYLHAIEKLSNCSWYNQAGQKMMTVMRVIGDRMIMRGCGRDRCYTRVGWQLLTYSVCLLKNMKLLLKAQTIAVLISLILF